ncbi:M20/M25/M40 family metallo-hydrolase [Myxococcus stipitatus]|uniref:M20/M25/M40 family metallo-hydrolase n=1 Tax=Myxococcus stipitatus TaxID=83455 RepID=UPI001F33320B|nr:M20/M25/M40 family metallo-hydrolase [Myxococcus stipitatus]MCE9672860.1 M20/M25/M40 family metallo-hydrolase [Myxococcus stipitatus]
MPSHPWSWSLTALSLCLALPAPAWAKPSASEAREREAALLMGSVLGGTPMLEDLRSLVDEVGGRATGSDANRRSVEWALERFRAAGVPAKSEPFRMPALWLEEAARATVQGQGVRFSPRVAAMPFSAATPKGGQSAPLVDVGRGAEADFTRVGAKARGAFVLVETDELRDVDDLFREYEEAVGIEARAVAAGATGVVYMGSRPGNQLYRHNVSSGPKNTRPMLVMERDGALRAQRLLRAGKALSLSATLELKTGGPYEAHNVIGEIRGATKPDEVVVLGAHLDSWDLGGGALDNGANVAMLIDLARQMKRLGLVPARTIRFALWNGEEQGMYGSSGYVASHAAELDGHVMALSVDIGCGRINGFFTNGRPPLVPLVDQALAPAAGLGPFTQVDVPVVGTDNLDFMLQGVANLIANQESATYGPNYHARSDEFSQCDARTLRGNAAVVGALAWGFATMETRLPRQGRSEVEALMRATDLPQQMKSFNLWEEWESGARGRPQGRQVSPAPR